MKISEEFVLKINQLLRTSKQKRKNRKTKKCIKKCLHCKMKFPFNTKKLKKFDHYKNYNFDDDENENKSFKLGYEDEKNKIELIMENQFNYYI